MGGIASHAIAVKDYTPSDYTNVEDYRELQDRLDKLAANRDVNRLSKVLLINSMSFFRLEYKTTGSSSGYFFSNAVDAFNNDQQILPGRSGGFIHTKKCDTACGSVGYISVIIKAYDKTYTVCCGFATSYSGKNKSGVQIRLRDGESNEKYGVDAHGVVFDIHQLINMNEHNGHKGEQTYSESTESIKVRVEFENENKSFYRFVFEDLN